MLRLSFLSALSSSKPMIPPIIAPAGPATDAPANIPITQPEPMFFWFTSAMGEIPRNLRALRLRRYMLAILRRIRLKSRNLFFLFVLVCEHKRNLQLLLRGTGTATMSLCISKYVFLSFIHEALGSLCGYLRFLFAPLFAPLKNGFLSSKNRGSAA